MVSLICIVALILITKCNFRMWHRWIFINEYHKYNCKYYILSTDCYNGNCLCVVNIYFNVHLKDSNTIELVIITCTSYMLYRKLLHLRACWERYVKFKMYYNIDRAWKRKNYRTDNKGDKYSQVDLTEVPNGIP